MKALLTQAEYNVAIIEPPPGVLCFGRARMRQGVISSMVEFVELVKVEDACSENIIANTLKSLKGLMKRVKSVKLVFSPNGTLESDIALLVYTSSNMSEFYLILYRVGRELNEEDILVFLDAYATGTIISEVGGISE